MKQKRYCRKEKFIISGALDVCFLKLPFDVWSFELSHFTLPLKIFYSKRLKLYILFGYFWGVKYLTEWKTQNTGLNKTNLINQSWKCKLTSIKENNPRNFLYIWERHELSLKLIERLFFPFEPLKNKLFESWGLKKKLMNIVQSQQTDTVIFFRWSRKLKYFYHAYIFLTWLLFQVSWYSVTASYLSADLFPDARFLLDH